jgi:hypothetical protein
MSSKEALTCVEVRGLLDYCPETGMFRWKARPEQTGQHKVWNIRYAGKNAGTLSSVGYVHICIKIGEKKFKFYAHRLAWLYVKGNWPFDEVDHVNGDKSDNRWANLRAATSSQNKANKRAQRNNRSGLKGVYFDGSRQKWAAQIQMNGISYRLGRFKTADAAKSAYEKAALNLHGEFARVR